jgi:AAA-like domain
MRRFHSYGPVNARSHFSVPRTDLVNHCLNSLIGSDSGNEGGHYFTIWAPRQTGKTWLTQEVKKRIESIYSDRFTVGMMSMQGVIMEDKDQVDVFFNYIPNLIRRAFGITVSEPDSWKSLSEYFSSDTGLFDKPVILFIDEFDKLPPRIIDRLVNIFRDMYLDRQNYCIYGLALIGVRAVLGVDSERGSPFNIQRSLHVPNFTLEEVTDLFDQYQRESGQAVEPEVVGSVYKSTNGQPGLVGWFGELLTEKYNPGIAVAIDLKTWETVYRKALYVEWNNTILNLIKKAMGEYQPYVLNLFSRSDIPFNLRAKWCSYLYLNGIITCMTQQKTNQEMVEICRFAAPFIQTCLFNSLTLDIIGDQTPGTAVDPLDDLADIFEGETLNLPSLLDRYKTYLVRMKAKGLNPFKDQPRRTDLHYTEAVGHFHLYAWLQAAIGRRCVTSPEFPTGNGKVDIHIRCNGKKGIIEVKSFVDMSETRKGTEQAAAYARSLNLNSVTLALFVPVDDETVLAKLSGEHQSSGVTVTVVAIGWT